MARCLTTRRLRTAGVIVGLVGAALAMPGLPAAAFDTSPDLVVTDSPANWTPDVVSSPGSVRYLAQTGNTMVAGGNFAQVKDKTTGTTLNRKNIFSFNATTGVVNPGFAPTIDALVHAVVIAQDGQKVFVGGEFKTVNGTSKVSLTELNLSDGSIVSTFKPPALDGRVFAMKLSGGWLYIAGSFTHVGVNAIPYLARLNTVTGAVDKNFTASFSGTNNPNNPGVTLLVKMDISPDGSRLVAIGNFMVANGLDRPQIALFDITGAAPTLVNWQTN